jgi:hypothetical protein
MSIATKNRTLRQPLVSIQIDGRQQQFQPGEVLAAAFQIDAVQPHELSAIEISVLWFTEGTGDEDLAVHYFERLSNESMPELDLSELRRFQTILPNSPLSYEGLSVKICWCIRVRVFLRGGREFVSEKIFQLGRVPLAQPVPEAAS